MMGLTDKMGEMLEVVKGQGRVERRVAIDDFGRRTGQPVDTDVDDGVGILFEVHR